ncbi:hypothetical protein SAMN05660199_02925 [Klenkia soli]|uniref:Uncharacterized protein n=1 Tax=Klenkia soli TaxID=1052260 RepID=A0A1H0P0X2_9ACTN|nr:hypothetical protein [Klenkia soli]SDO98355.1 hypothetical protein SAMN05660199_02925 [Klenkia soli]
MNPEAAGWLVAALLGLAQAALLVDRRQLLRDRRRLHTGRAAADRIAADPTATTVSCCCTPRTGPAR